MLFVITVGIGGAIAFPIFFFTIAVPDYTESGYLGRVQSLRRDLQPVTLNLQEICLKR